MEINLNYHKGASFKENHLMTTACDECIVLGITLEKLNGPGYGTNVHIFILGSCNILSFTNISLSMWEEL
jgi:hypothetical protein